MEIYVDMDGVLADFRRQFKKVVGQDVDEFTSKYGDGDEFWDAVSVGGSKFWTEMPWIKDGKQLWQYVEKYNPTILSSPSRQSFCIGAKKVWLGREISQKVAKNAIFAKSKFKKNYSGKDKILIDDLKKNIDAWESMGGMGILHTSTNSTIKKLKKYLK